MTLIGQMVNGEWLIGEIEKNTKSEYRNSKQIQTCCDGRSTASDRNTKLKRRRTENRRQEDKKVGHKKAQKTQRKIGHELTRIDTNLFNRGGRGGKIKD